MSDYELDRMGVCDRCARKVALVAREGDSAIWSDSEPGREAGADESFTRFKAGIAAQIADDDVDSHGNLADAYRAMGLYADAVRELGMVVNGARDATVVVGALRQLFSPPLLRADGFSRLLGRVLA